MVFAYQQLSYHLLEGRDESRFKYNIEYQPGYARYDLQMNQVSKTGKLAFEFRNTVRKIVSRVDKIIGSNISAKLTRNTLQTESYDSLCHEIVNRKPDSEKAIPGMFVGWDNTPRRGKTGRVCLGATPEKFAKYLKLQIENAEKNYKKDMLFIFAWNEWAEGGYLEPDTKNRYTDSFSIDGKLKFVSFNCQRFDSKAINPYTPAAYSWPSSMTEEHQEELKNEIQRLIKLLGMKTAVYNIETREGMDGKAYIMEVSPRGGGNRLAECLRYATGVDIITAMVRYAVGMDVYDVSQEPYDGCWAEIILHSDKPGIFKELWISDELSENVIERDLWIEEGTTVGGFEAANEAVGTLVLKLESQERVEEILTNQDKYVRVILK